MTQDTINRLCINLEMSHIIYHYQTILYYIHEQVAQRNMHTYTDIYTHTNKHIYTLQRNKHTETHPTTQTFDTQSG